MTIRCRLSVVCMGRFQKRAMAVSLLHGCFGLSDVRPASLVSGAAHFVGPGTWKALGPAGEFALCRCASALQAPPPSTRTTAAAKRTTMGTGNGGTNGGSGTLHSLTVVRIAGTIVTMP